MLILLHENNIRSAKQKFQIQCPISVHCPSVLFQKYVKHMIVKNTVEQQEEAYSIKHILLG